MLGDIVSVSGYHFEEEEYVWYLEITKWRRHDFDWDLSRAAKKKKIEMIINKQTKQENGQ